MRIYLASSWRNLNQPVVLAALRAAGHEVYDFKNPAPGDNGFSWRQIRPDLHENLNARVMRETLAHPVAGHGFALDFDAMKAAEVCVLLLPCGRSDVDGATPIFATVEEVIEWLSEYAGG
jgi:hypothetical protein